MNPEQEDKIELQQVEAAVLERTGSQPLKPDASVELRSRLDNLPVAAAIKVYWRLSVLCMLAAFSASCDGFQGHFNGSIVANKGFIRQFSGGGAKLDPTWVSVWGGTSTAATFFSQVLIAYVNDYAGRRIALWCTFVLLTASTLAESFVTNNVGWLFAKILSGVGVGAMQGTLPMYLAELAPTQLRGLFTQAYTFWYVIGQLLSSVPLQWYSDHEPYNFRSPIRIQFAVIGILLLVYLVLPESPRWLIQTKRHERAKKTLAWLHKGVPGYQVDEQVAIIENTVAEERKHNAVIGGLGLGIFRGTNGWRLFIASWPKICQQFVGLSVFNTYATYFFDTAGFADPFLITVILACAQLMSMIITMFLVDVWGRRPMTVYGYLVTVIADFGMGATGFRNVSKSPAMGGLLVFFACLATFSTTSASAIGYAYLAEIPKQDLRAKSAGWGLAISNLFSTMFSYCVPLMIAGSAGWGVKTGLFFGCTGLIVVAAAWFILPEVTRRTPAEIDEMFEKKINPRQFKGYITEAQSHTGGQDEL